VFITKAAVETASEVYVDLCKEKTIRVLHVDDEAGFLAVAKQCLEDRSQFQVDTALSVKEALEKLKRSEYDAIISDYQIDGKNGLEFLRELRLQGNETPFILFTCKSKGEIAIEALNSGVYRYIGKEGNAEVTYGELKRSICDAVRGQRTERLLKEAENRLHQITDNMHDLLLLTDENLEIKYASASYKPVLGYAPNEIIGKRAYDFVHPDDLPKVLETAAKAFKKKTATTFESRVKNADGKYMLLEGTGKPLVDKEGNVTGVVMTSRDITERKKIEEKMQFQARLLNSIGQAVIATDTNGAIIYWNHAAEQVYGWKQNEVLGNSIVDLFMGDAFQQLEESLMFSRGKAWTGETVIKRRDGRFLSVIITATSITDDKGEMTGILGVSTDITEQKWMQQILNEAIEKVVELNEKLHVVESLTRHDIRNKLAALNGRIFLLKKRFNGNTEALTHLKELESASQQILKILEFEKNYVQVGSEELKNVDVERYVTEASLLFSDLKGAKIINDCNGLTVLADSMLRQLFYNMMDNTLKYGKKTSEIKVYYKEEANQLKLIYEDDGVGIPDDEKSKLFQEGYGKGTGFGLYLIKRICEGYGWKIQETGKHGKSAQFTMTIPKSAKDGARLYEIS
jgi:PAS domain S-box-containing protein